MKKILFLLAILLVGCSSNKITDLENLQLKGNIASVKVSIYEAESKFGEIVKGNLEYDEITITEFNNLGYITSNTFYDRDGDILYKEIYSYNNNNNLDNISEYTSHGDLFYKTVYKWNNNYLLSVITYENDGEEMNKYLYEYEGNIHTSSTRYWKGEFESKDIYKYDNNLIKGCISYDKDGKEINRFEYEIENNQAVKYISISNDRTQIIEYENGLPIKSENCYQIQNQINIIDEILYYYEYEFDNNDSWIKCIIYKGEAKQPHLIIEREITYK